MTPSTGDELLPNSVGFIGLGAMGKPMVINLARNLPPKSQIYVHDTVDAPVNELCTRLPDIVVKSVSAKDVAEKSVSSLCCDVQ